MLQRGRRSKAKLAIASASDRKRPRINPPAFLSTAGRSLFADIVASCPPKQFTKSDAELLATFAAVTLIVRETAGDPEAFNKWEKAARLQASLAVRLKLTPSSRPTKALGRGVPDPDDGPFPWEED